jgi:hypothetical protein
VSDKIGYVRLYGGPDGESHFEERQIDLGELRWATRVTALIPTDGNMLFRTNGADYELEFHPAPRRQFCFNLQGSVEITASDGEVRVFGPGSIMLADDAGSKGHRSRASGSEERIALFVHVDHIP